MRDRGHADRYTDLTINYVFHHNPDLILFDADGEELQRIDLTRLKTTQNIHKLMKMLGMRETCENHSEECAGWAATGQCSENANYMHLSCRKACGLCGSNDPGNASESCVNDSPDRDCQYWSTMGECVKNEAFMSTACARSCGICKVALRASPVDEEEALLDEMERRSKDEL